MDVKRIRKVEEGKYNPFNSLGIDPLLIHTIPQDRLKSFLKDFKKYFLGKYHHPDRYLAEEDKEKHKVHFQRVAGEIDELLADDFYFRHCLANFGPTGDLAEYERKLNSQRRRILELGKKNKGLESELRTIQDFHINTGDELSQVAKDRRRLCLEDNIYSLVAGKNYSLRYLSLEGEDINFGSRIGELFTMGEEPAVIEREGRRISHDITSKVLKEQGEKNHKRLKRGWKRKDRMPKLYVGGVGFSKGEILGSFPYFAIQQYLKSQNMDLISNEEDINQDIPLERNAAIMEDFSFKSNSLGLCMEGLKKIYPFLSPFILEDTPLMVKFKERDNWRKIDHYKLVLPARIRPL